MIINQKNKTINLEREKSFKFKHNFCPHFITMWYNLYLLTSIQILLNRGTKIPPQNKLVNN